MHFARLAKRFVIELPVSRYVATRAAWNNFAIHNHHYLRLRSRRRLRQRCPFQLDLPSLVPGHAQRLTVVVVDRA